MPMLFIALLLALGAGFFWLARVRFAVTLDRTLGMGSPLTTADEADDSYRALWRRWELARVPTATKLLLPAARPGEAFLRAEVAMRAMFGNHGFTLSVLAAVAVTAFFAFVFEASQQLVATLLVLGLFTALMEYMMRSKSEPPR
jgi:hypothetical protein